MSALLETNELTVSYGGLHANSNVNIKAEKGKLTGLIGPAVFAATLVTSPLKASPLAAKLQRSEGVGLLRVAEADIHQVRLRRVLQQHLQVELVWPRITIARALRSILDESVREFVPLPLLGRL